MNHLDSYGNVWGQSGLQIRMNNSSFELAKLCLRKYQYKIKRGLRKRQEKADLRFGTLVHEGFEHYDQLRLLGLKHDDALRDVVDQALSSTWDSELNRAEEFDHNIKTRNGLVRVLIWYLDRYPKEEDLELLMIGKSPALELPFEFASNFKYKSTGEMVTFIGKLDRMVLFNDKPYVMDRKTTKSALNAQYFASYSPNGQVSQYTIAGRVCFDVPIRGLIIDGIQVGVNFARFQREIVHRDDSTLDEWLRDASFYLSRLEDAELTNHYPQNDSACGLYGGCEFRDICKMPPEAREMWLKQGWIESQSNKEEEGK